ncbi:MAG: LacI family DNA-binding transcriptional regulator [Rhodospirillales bacterium]|nr:LacI family DNA-binding transcriptional regulator [Rhodospirillales bacterium]
MSKFKKSRKNAAPAKIADVARMAGVSSATVSRTLANPAIVTESTRSRVMAAVRKCGYTPNIAARNLRARKSLMALVVVPNIANPFFAEVLRGIDLKLSANGYGLIIANLDGSADKEARYVDLAAAGQVDGVLLLCGHIPQGVSRSLFDANVPIVAACETIPGAAIPQVEVDNRAASRAAVRHLVELGHRRIGYLSGPSINVLDKARRAGFMDVLGSLRPAAVWEGDFTFAAGVGAARRMLDMPATRRPTAVFAANDEMAIGFLKTAHAAGMSIPDDLSIVGFDAIEYAEYCEPTLTTIYQPRLEIGMHAADQLVRLMTAPESSRPEIIRLETRLLVRGSTGTAPAP